MNKEEELQMQLANENLKVLKELKSHTDLCKFYKDNFDTIKNLIIKRGAKLAIEDMVNLGMPQKDEILFFDEFIKQINNVIKRGGITKDDL